MSSPPTPNIVGASNERSNVFIMKYSAGYSPQSSSGSLPLLNLPQGFSSYAFSKANIDFGGKEVVFIPAVNPILTEYCNECLQTFFTIEFIELVNQQSFPLLFSIRDEKLEYAVNLYYTICNLPSKTNDGEIRKVLAFYLGSRLFPNDFFKSGNESNLTELRNSLALIAKKYYDRLLQVSYLYQKKTVKVTEARAQEFIDKANSEMEKDLNFYFAATRVRAVVLNAESVISDPRFRPSLEDARWDEYDETIKKEVAYYNRKFSGTPGFKPLDWRLIKAMVWTEVLAGPKGNPTQWQKYPMQIGRFAADAGYLVVSTGRADEGADLITSAEFRQEIQDKNKVVGHVNVRAGIAYVYTRAIKGKVSSREVIDNAQVESYTVQRTDNKGLDDIAKRFQTTSDNIVRNTPGITKTTVLRIGQQLFYQKAHLERFISGWNDWETTIKSYNSEAGDPKYKDKISRAYQIIISRTPE